MENDIKIYEQPRFFVTDNYFGCLSVKTIRYAYYVPENITQFMEYAIAYLVKDEYAMEVYCNHTKEWTCFTFGYNTSSKDYLSYKIDDFYRRFDRYILKDCLLVNDYLYPFVFYVSGENTITLKVNALVNLEYLISQFPLVNPWLRTNTNNYLTIPKELCEEPKEN